MAKTLQEYKKEFEAIKKAMGPLADDIQSNENNLNHHREMLNENFEMLGPRIHELRDGGIVGTTIEAFMHDKEIATMIKELGVQRDTAKKTAVATQTLIDRQLKPLLKRVTDLQSGLETEIATRKKKFSSAKLNVNQSWKEMEPLLTSLKDWMKSNADYEWAKNYVITGTYPPGQFDRVYTMLLDKELKKSKAVMLNAFQEMMQTQMLNTKNLQKNFAKARKLYDEIADAAKDGKQAHGKRDIQTLSKAKVTASTSLTKLGEVVEPYLKALSDAKIKDMVAHSKDKNKIEQGVDGMGNMFKKAKQLEDELRSRTFA